MKQQFVSKFKQLIFPFYERTFLQYKTGRGVATVRPFTTISENENDISDHLHFLNLFINLFKPTNIVELGTRGGESTRVFVDYVSRNGKSGFSVDLSSQPLWLKGLENWRHFVGDDCLIGESIKEKGIWPDGTAFDKIDLLFIDTSHEYNHTTQELEIWVPLVRSEGWILFHDTNLSGKATRRLSGKLNYGWDNSRGVTRAIEEYFKIQVSERELYSESHNMGLDFIFHIPWNNGFTAVRKI